MVMLLDYYILYIDLSVNQLIHSTCSLVYVYVVLILYSYIQCMYVYTIYTSIHTHHYLT